MATRKRLANSEPVSPPTRRGGGTGKGRPPNPYSRTRIIARAMILAAEELSPDGTLLGFLIEAGKTEPQCFTAALYRVMSAQGWSPHEAVVEYVPPRSARVITHPDDFHAEDKFLWRGRKHNDR